MAVPLTLIVLNAALLYVIFLMLLKQSLSCPHPPPTPLLFPVFGEVPCDPALQIRQPAVHPASEALTLMLLSTQWKDQNPNPFSFPLTSSCKYKSSRYKAPVVLTHTFPHVHACGHEGL